MAWTMTARTLRKFLMFFYTRMTDSRYNYEPAMQPREQGQAMIRQNNGQRRHIEVMCEENRQVSW